MQDFVTVERYDTMPGVKYRGADQCRQRWLPAALQLGDTNIVADLYCPVGTCYMINTKYFALYFSEDATFLFSGFYSAIPNYFQVANVGLMICGPADAFGQAGQRPQDSRYHWRGVLAGPRGSTTHAYWLSGRHFRLRSNSISRRPAAGLSPPRGAVLGHARPLYVA